MMFGTRDHSASAAVLKGRMSTFDLYEISSIHTSAGAFSADLLVVGDCGVNLEGIYIHV